MDAATQTNMAQGMEEYRALVDSGADAETLAAKFNAVVLGITQPKAVEVAKTTEVPLPRTKLSGYAVPNGDGGWRLKVESVEGDAVRLPEHGTVFVNGVEPTIDPVTGVATFETEHGNVRPATFGIERPGPKGPELPAQTDLQLAEARQRQAVRETGLDQPYLHPAEQGLPDPQADVFDLGTPVGDIVQDFAIQPHVKAALESVGVEAPPAQTPDVERLATQIDVAHSTLADSQTRETVDATDPVVVSDIVAKLKNAAEQVRDAQAVVLKVGSLHSQVNTAEQDAALARLAIYTKEAQDLAAKAGSVGPNKVTSDQAQWTAMEGKNGARVGGFKSASEAAEWLAEYKAKNPDDHEAWEPRDSGKGRGYHIAKRTQVVSLDKPIIGRTTLGEMQTDMSHEQGDVPTEGSTVLHDSDLPPEGLDATPQERLKNLMSLRDEVAKNPQALARLATDGDVAEAIGLLREAKTLIEKAQKGTKLTSAEARDLGTFSMHMYDVTGRRANFLVRSKVPFDPVTVAQMGLLDPVRGLRNGLEWFAANAKRWNAEHMGELVRAMLKARPDIDGTAFTHSEHPEWDPQGGWYFTNDQGVRPRINAPDLPQNAEDAFTWSLRLVHEFTHDTARELKSRVASGDVRAIELEKTLETVRGMVEKSEFLPKKVRELIARARKEGHYERLTGGNKWKALNVNQLGQKFNNALGYLRQESENALLYLNREKPNVEEVTGIQKDLLHRAQRDGVPQSIIKLIEQGDWKTLAKVTLNDFVQQGKVKRGPSWDGNAMLEDWRRTAGKLADEWKEVIYGTLNTDELLAQTFGSPEMLAVLKNTKMEKTIKQSLLEFFSAAWNRLFGGPVTSDTALAEVLQRFDKYLNVGRPEGYNGKQFQRDLLVNQGTRGKAMASRLKTVEETYNTGLLKASLDGLDREAEHSLLPTGMEYESLNPRLRTALLMGGPEDVFKATYNLLLDDLPSAEAAHYRAFEDVSLAQRTLAEVRAGQIPGVVPEGVEAALRGQMVKLHRMREALNKQARALRTARDLDNFTLEGANTLLSSILQGRPLPAPPGPVPGDVLSHAQELLGMRQERSREALEGKGRMGFLEKALGLQQFVARAHPAVKDIVNGMMHRQQEATQRANELNLAYNFDPKTGELSKERMNTLDWVTANVEAAKDYSAIKQWMQVQEAQGKPWTLDDAVPKKILSKWSEQGRKGRVNDREALRLALESSATRHGVAVRKVWPEFFAAHNTELTGTVIALAEPGILPAQARENSRKLYEALRGMQDPATAPMAIAQWQALATSMSPDTFARATQHAQGMLQETQKFLDLMAKRPNFATEQRYADHHVRMIGVGGDTNYTSHKTREAALAYVKRKESEGYTLLDYIPKEDANAPKSGVSDDVMSYIREYDTQTMQKMQDIFAAQPDVLAQIMPLAERASQLESALAAFKPVPGATRKFVGGREEINMLENEDAFYTKANNWMRHKMTKAQANLDKLHPDIATNRELSKYTEDVVSQYLTPDNPTVQKLVKWTYFMKLGMDVGQAMIESTQSLSTGMTALISETGGVGDAMSRTNKAVNEIAKHRLTKKWASEDHEWLMAQAGFKGVRGTSMWNEIYDPDKATMHEVNHRRGNPVGQAMHVMDHSAKKWSRMFTTFNDDIGLLSAFDLGRERGMTRQEAFDFAVDLKNRGYFTQGKAGRPQGLWSFKTKAIPQLVSSLQNYTLGWFGLMADTYRAGFGKNPPAGLTELQRQGARKGFVYALAAQAVFAGALGLPGVGQGLALLEQGTGVDVKGWLRKNLTNLFDEDQQDGGIMTSIALRGLSSGVTPFDPSSRMSVGVPFIGVDSYKGFSLANLAGAPLTTASDFVQGLLATARGDKQGIEKLLPNALKRPFQLWQGEGDIRDKRGGLLYELSPSERVMMALGMPSARIQNSKDIALAADKIQESALRERQAFADQVAELTRKGNLSMAHQRLAEYAAANPNADMQAMVRNVAQRVQAQSFPYDVRRDLNPAADLQGLAPSLAPTSAARFRMKSQTLRDLGGRAPRAGRVGPAQLDALQLQNPYQGLPALQQKGRKPSHPLDFLSGSPYQ